MIAFDRYRELRNGKRYNRSTYYEMSENGSIEGNMVRNPSENTKEEASEVTVLTQEVVNEQIKGFIFTSRGR